jgi:hypothetical protein
MEFDYLMDEKEAVEVLAHSLLNGSLVLFLGAGVSLGASLPCWKCLIYSMREEKGMTIENIGDTADKLQVAANEIETAFYPKDKPGFAELVRKCLYKEVELDESLLGEKGLLALGALMFGSRRGSVKRVVTLNFDCILEWYLSRFGHIQQVIFEPPAIEGCEDVRIYHPHGFLPHRDLKTQGSSFVVLGLQSVNKRLADPNDPWFVLLRHILTSGICLFVGLSARSFEDRVLGPLLEYAAEKNKMSHPELPTGFWIVNLEGEHKTEEEAKRLQDRFLASRVVPLLQPTKEGIPNLLFRICQRAAELACV